MVILSSALDSALDCSATFLTDLAGRTVKKLASPIGPGFESRSRRQKGHRSIPMRAAKSYNLAKLYPNLTLPVA